MDTEDDTNSSAISQAAVAALAMLHRHDNYVTFHQREKFQQVAAIRASELATMFPSYIAQLVQDSYYSINGMRKKWRNGKLVSRLTSCFVDIDLHDDPTPEKVEIAIEAVLAVKDIPRPNVIVRSGRGFWAFWLLREPDSDRAIAATPGAKALWFRLQRALRDRLATRGFPVDGAAGDLARLTRIPGSINTKAGREVVYDFFFKTDGAFRPIVYTLPELARSLGEPETVEPFVCPPPKRLRLSPDLSAAIADRNTETNRGPRSAKSERGATGSRALRLRRFRDFDLLVSIRGKFPDGVRNRAALLLACLTRGVSTQRERVFKFGRHYCSPPLEVFAIEAALKQANKPRWLKLYDRTIGDWLEITPAENAELEGEYLSAPPARSTRRADKTKRRRELVSEICAGGAIPPLSEIKKLLAGNGVSASRQTISDDLLALGLENPRRKGQQPQQPLRLIVAEAA